jgi:hypothetical protein
MSQVSQLSPELASGVLRLAHVLPAAARTWTLHPSEPAVAWWPTRRSGDAPGRSGGVISTIAVMPDTLPVEGAQNSTS